MAIDDQLNILPISSHTLNISALPPKSKVNFLFIAYTRSPLWSRGGGGLSEKHHQKIITGLDTMEVMKEMFLIIHWNICSIFTDTT